MQTSRINVKPARGDGRPTVPGTREALFGGGWSSSSPTPPTTSRPTSTEPGNERTRGAAPVRNTPVALVRRKNFAIWNSVFPQPALNDVEFSTTTRAVHDYLSSHGASFFTDIVDGTKLLRAQVEESLAELVANGLVISDSFAGLRALLTPASRRTQAAARRKHRQPVYEMASAGRWSLLQRGAGSVDIRSAMSAEREKSDADRMSALPAPDPEAAEEIARILLKRYGVVFKRLLEREGIVLPWRVLLRIYHRLEARGEIRGGRFVAGISGEQFALPEAVERLREIRRSGADHRLVTISAADPLNLVGIITPGGRVTGPGWRCCSGSTSRSGTMPRSALPSVPLPSGVRPRGNRRRPVSRSCTIPSATALPRAASSC